MGRKVPKILKFEPVAKGRKGSFYQNQYFFRDGKVMLFQRADHKDKKWNARYRIQGRYKVKSLRTADFSKAKTVALEEYDELRFKDKHGLPIFDKSFEAVAEEFIEYGFKRIEAGEISQYWAGTAQSILRNWQRYLANLDVNKIPQEKIDGYIEWRNKNNRYNKPIKMETAVTELSYLRQCLYWARDRKYVSEVQIPYIKPPKIPQHKRRKREPFTLVEYQRLYRFMRRWVKEPNDPDVIYDREILRHYILFLANTGLRTGSETKDLRWKDIEYRDDGHIYIWVSGGKRGADECAAQPRLKPTLERWRKMAYSSEPDDIVFAKIHNKRGVTDKFKLLFNSLLEESGLRVGRQGTKRTLYSLRHTFITFALRYGNNPDAFFIAKNCRTSVKQIENHYGHVKAEDFADRVTRRRKHSR